MLNVVVFNGNRVATADAHTVVIRDKATSRAVVIVQRHDELTEVMTPDHPNFDELLRILEGATEFKLKPPNSIRFEG